VTWQRWVLVVALCCSCPFRALAGVPPTSLDLQLTTWENTSLTFDVVVTDIDIDPLAPETHPLEFVVTEAPTHGVVAGDLAAVIYRLPSEAILILSYTPAEGFLGTDGLRLQARDSLGESVGILVTIEVVARGSVGELAGHSLVTATIDVPTVTLTSMSWSGDAKYTLFATSLQVGFLFKRQAVDSAFDDLYINLSSPFGGVGMLASHIDFDPDPATGLFDHADVSLTLRVGSSSMLASLYTDGTQSGSRMSFGFFGSTNDGGLSLSSRVNLVSCSPYFDMASVTLRAAGFPSGLGACAIDLSGTASFSSSGFEKATISASGMDFPDVGWLSLVTSANVTVSFEVQTKSLTITPQFETPIVDCIRFGTEIVWAGNALADLRLTSIHVDHTFANGVRLRMHTSLDPTDLTLNQSVTGHLDYWEADVLSGEFEVCTGVGGDWEVGVYFSRPGVGVQLFDWGMLELKASVACGRQWELFTELTFRSGVFGDPTSEWLLGFAVAW
jgi:hypothetical protein